MTAPLADTLYGKVRGTEEDGVKVWRGIPFAAPPVGQLRFRAPQPPQPWDSLREAVSFGPVSLQPVSTSSTRFGGLSPVYSEDCLYLNVWSPASAGERLPVMVWIHGGTFVTGAGSQPMFDGAHMARKGNVVLVTLNYRLGPFGFLHLSPLGGGLASNAGLLDQIAALEWVQGNIAAFGGDPQRVTVFGESAGSMSIAAQLGMPAAEGLFAGAIMESGAAQSLPSRQGLEISAALLSELGLAPNADLTLLDTLSAEDILQAAARMTYKLSGEALSMFFQPVVEPATLPVDPAEAAASGIPLMIGTNLHEGNLFFREERQGESFEQSLKSLELLMGIEDLAGLADGYPKSWAGQAEFLTDLFFWGSSIAFAESHSAAAPVWMYRFDWTAPGHPLLAKAVHGAEILFVFGNLHLLKQLGLTVTPEIQKLSDCMLKTWTAFAHRGDPSLESLEWPQYGETTRATLVFNTETRVVLDPDAEKRRRLFSASASWPKAYSAGNGE